MLEELVRNKFLEGANQVFLRGAKGGLKATNELYDLMIEEDCKAGDHSNALEIAYEMEAAGRMATTRHFNHLLSVQVSFLNVVIFLIKYWNFVATCKQFFFYNYRNSNLRQLEVWFNWTNKLPEKGVVWFIKKQDFE